MSGVGMGTFIFNLVSTYLVNPNSENADKGGLFPEDVAENLPRMIRILCACWVSIGVVGIALIFPFKPEIKVEQNLDLLRIQATSVFSDNQGQNINMTYGNIKLFKFILL